MPFQDLRSQEKRRTKEELIKHMYEFNLELKFSVGIWYFSPGGGRFHDRYVPNMSIKERKENKKLLAQGHKMVGLNPEVGHVHMGFEDLPYAYSRVAREGRLAHTHLE